MGGRDEGIERERYDYGEGYVMREHVGVTV